MHGTDQPVGHSGGAGGDHAQAGKVGALPAPTGHHHVELRRHQHRERDALALDGVERGVHIELRMQHHGAADTKAGRGLIVEAADVEQRQRGENDVVGCQAVHVRAVGCIPGQRALAQQHALRFAGRAGGIADQQRRIGTGQGITCYGIAGTPEKVFIGDPAARCLAQVHQLHQSRVPERTAEGIGLLEELRLDEQHLRRTVSQHLAVFGTGQPPVERHEQGAQAGAGEQHGKHFRAVESQIGHAGAASDTRRRQRRAQLPYQRGQIGIRQIAIRKAKRQLVGRKPGMTVYPFRQIHTLSPLCTAGRLVRLCSGDSIVVPARARRAHLITLRHTPPARLPWRYPPLRSR